MDYKFLLDRAKEARKQAYAPYSQFKVGAALLTREKEVFTGCNIENSSYSATICAERVCVFNAVSQGFKEFTALAIYVGSKIAAPCGECLQVLFEFNGNILIIMGGEGKYLEKPLSQLLPCPFKFSP